MKTEPPSHTTRRIATVLGLLTIGIYGAILKHDHTLDLIAEVDALRANNMQLIQNTDTYIHCMPRSEGVQVTIVMHDGRATCETHTLNRFDGRRK
jgi:hypothetical protein